ncbi:MAG: N-acetyl-gamma-glutamyl-phosphate reductase [Candidatus Azotimanducaceae bacterium]|jgi:N-acetyl-gamma-glutamyl-phosphate reductase
MATIFIDGQAGTTGIQITERLQAREDLELVYLDDSERKDPNRRQDCLQSADISILCLPDDAAREALQLAAGQGRIIDASTAHRIDPSWAYGLPELNAQTRANIKTASRVSNPGCYPQGFILSIRPLIDNGLLEPASLLRCHAVSGYSGGGRQMIETQQEFSDAQQDSLNSQVYGLDLQHKHVPEMQVFSGLQQKPIFSPTVAHYYQGMVVQIPLFLAELNVNTATDVHQCLSDSYAQEKFIDVLPMGFEMTNNGFLNATACNDTNKVELMVFANDEQLLIVSRYDTLGKGAAGAAVQNLNLMLGIDEGVSL